MQDFRIHTRSSSRFLFTDAWVALQSERLQSAKQNKFTYLCKCITNTKFEKEHTVLSHKCIIMHISEFHPVLHCLC